jgi:hypothetical protein
MTLNSREARLVAVVAFLRRACAGLPLAAQWMRGKSLDG